MKPLRAWNWPWRQFLFRVETGLHFSAKSEAKARGLGSDLGSKWGFLADARLWLGLGVVLFVWLIWPRMGACAGGSDSSGYFNHAKLLSEGRWSEVERMLPGLSAEEDHPYLYVPLGFKPSDIPGRMVATYPAGLPLLVAVTAKVVGWRNAGNVLMCVHAVLGLLAVYLLGRTMGLAPFWALGGVFLTGMSPLYLYFAVQLMSDLPAMVWVTMAVWFALCVERRGAGFALAAGFSLSVAVLLRPSDVLILLPVLSALLWAPWSWRTMTCLLFGGLPLAFLLLVINFCEYGHIFTTGYGDASCLFAWGNIPASLTQYVSWLPVLFSPLMVLSLGLPWLWKSAPRAVCVLGLWICGILGFYAPYFHTHEVWWYLRFVLPAAPALIVAALLVMARLAHSIPSRGWRALVLVLLFALSGYQLRGLTRRLSSLSIGKGELVYLELADLVKAKLPPDTVICGMQCTGAFYHYLPNVLVRWDMLDTQRFERVRSLSLESGRRLVAVLFAFEKDEAFRRMPGTWVQIGQVRDITVWECVGLRR